MSKFAAGDDARDVTASMGLPRDEGIVLVLGGATVERDVTVAEALDEVRAWWRTFDAALLVTITKDVSLKSLRLSMWSLHGVQSNGAMGRSKFGKRGGEVGA